MQHKLLTLLICFWLGAVQAAELGDVAPRSYIGQPLAADIDLLALTPDELANLQVRLADANVYRGANVAMNPALSTVRLQVEKRGQKPVLHVTTTQPVAADYVHVYVRLGVPGKQDVRLATVWLQPDPNPAPPPQPQPVVPVASALTAAQAEQIAAQARAARLTVGKEAAAKDAPGKDVAGRDAAAREAAGRDAATKEAAGREAAGKDAAARDGLARQAAEEAARQASAAPARDRSKPAPLPSMHEAETGVPGEVKAAAAARRIAGVWVSADGKPTRAPTSEDAPTVPVGVAQALLPLAPLPLPKGVKRPAAACAPTGMSAKACVALDAHNAELSSKLTELEGKMKALQGALGGAASAAAVTKGAQAVSPAVPGGHTAPAGKATMPPASASASAPGSLAAAASAPAAASASAAAPAQAAAASVPAPAKVPGAGGVGASASGTAPTSGSASAAAADQGGARHGAEAAAPSATANLLARAEPEAHAAKAAAGQGEAVVSGGASAEAAAPPPPVATKQIRVLPKLKYKKEKPAEPQTNYTLPIAGGIGLLALLGGGLFWWRKKKSGKGPLKIWQGFRKKKPVEPGPEDFVEVNTAA